MLFVPLHGSFWLATHPAGVHPRRNEFLASGRFVFGNGGVGRVVESASTHAAVGDFVAVFGHLPCRHADCIPCHVEHRYVECTYGDSTILGHGKGALDGTLARYAVLPDLAYEVCFRAGERPPVDALLPFMFAFLLADVRNALTRLAPAPRRPHMLLLGAGQAGHLAAWLHLRSHPGTSLVAVDPSTSRLASLRSLAPAAIATYRPGREVLARLARGGRSLRDNPAVAGATRGIARAVRRHFGGRGIDLLFDASSGNTAPLWDNTTILSPGCQVIVFGFGSDRVVLDNQALQRSGLSLLASRGVGTLDNRRAVITLLRGAGASFVRQFLVDPAVRLGSLTEALAFARRHHQRLPGAGVPAAFVTPVSLPPSSPA